MLAVKSKNSLTGAPKYVARFWSLGEPSLEGFLHQFRHHLQNKAREPQYKYLLVENDPKADYRIPYKDCVYRMYGEDDARAWARMVIELAS